MERWIGGLPARWAIVLGAVLLALTLSLASYHIAAVGTDQSAAPPEKPKEQSQRTHPTSKTNREALRYGGKDFDQWRVGLETELKPEIRVDGLTAMGAFGANGYGPEATRTIVDLMAGYDLKISNDKDKAVVEAAIEAIRKIGKPALPVLWEGVRGDNERSRLFAVECLDYFDSDWHPPVVELLKAAQHEDMYVRKTALELLENVKNKPKNCLPVLLECLNDKEADVRGTAIDRLDEMRPEAREVMSALRTAIGDTEPWVRYRALDMAGHYGAQAKPIVPELMKRLEKPDALARAIGGVDVDEFVALMGTLTAIGPAAKEALPRLRKLRDEWLAEEPQSTLNRMDIKRKYRSIINLTIEKIEGK
jgi:HEAT repeat protein